MLELIGARQGGPGCQASNPCAASAFSYHFSCSAPPWWHTAFSRFVPVVNSEVSVLASGSNCAVKPTRLRWAAYFRSLVPSPVSCAQPPVPALRPVPKAFKPFGPPALVQQAPAAIILAALRRFCGPALFRGPRPSSRQGVPFWPSGLTVRRSRPPTAAAELRALGQDARCAHLLAILNLARRRKKWGFGTL